MFAKTLSEIDINGDILLIDKPLRWTSFDVVNKLKYLIKQEFGIKKFKIGHAGTLDPLASGLLIVCIGKCTKQIPVIQDGIKGYEGTFTLGATTASYDLEKDPENFLPYQHLTALDIEQAKEKFLGEQWQTPPVFSAVRIDGKRAFDLARKGQEIAIQPKKIHIYQFDILQTDLPQVDFAISCSKGTYIRALARDFGAALGCGAYLSALKRTQIGQITLKHSLFDFNQYIDKNKVPDENRRKRDFEK